MSGFTPHSGVMQRSSDLAQCRTPGVGPEALSTQPLRTPAQGAARLVSWPMWRGIPGTGVPSIQPPQGLHSLGQGPHLLVLTNRSGSSPLQASWTSVPFLSSGLCPSFLFSSYSKTLHLTSVQSAFSHRVWKHGYLSSSSSSHPEGAIKARKCK